MEIQANDEGQEKYTSITVRVPVNMVNRIDTAAKRAYISRSAVIRQMLSLALSQAQDSPAIDFTTS